MSAKREDINDTDVWYMYEVDGMTQQEIADYYGVGRTTIRYRLHPEKQKESSKQRRLEHPEYGNEWMQNTDKGKAYVIRRHAERRNLGSIELNKPFPNSEGHHIDETYIIHIPKELHRSIPHNLKTGEGMSDINEIAFQYITEDTFDKLIAGEI